MYFLVWNLKLENFLKIKDVLILERTKLKSAEMENFLKIKYVLILERPNFSDNLKKIGRN